MRQVIRNYNIKPHILTLASTIAAWDNVAMAGNAAGIERKLYSDPYYDVNKNTASKVIDTLNRWYLLKCAYCERFYKLDVEHYRPKGEVRDGDNTIVKVHNPVGARVTHPGYYWLGYEWSNLLPACISCNREGGKGSKFPTITSYNIVAPINAGIFDKSRCFVGHVDLTCEEPYLLHPEHDAIDGMFRFEIAGKKLGIKIIGNDVAGRGHMTIKLCQLNRPEITMSRLKSVVEPIRNSLLAIMKFLAVGRKSMQETRGEVETLLQKLYDDTANETIDYTYLRKYIMENSANFEQIVIPFIPQPMQRILLSAYNNYIPL